MDASTQRELPGLVVQESSDQAQNPAYQQRGYKSLVSRAIEVFGDEITADRWLSLPCADLGGRVPLQVAEDQDFDDKKWKDLFEPIFVRIEHGIYY